MKIQNLCKTILASITLFAANASFAAVIANTASVYLNSDPGSWVGGGIGAQTVTWTHGIDGLFYGGPNYGDFNQGVEISYDGGSNWTFQFAAPSYDPLTNTNDGQLLQTEMYEGAQRFPFNSPTKPGMNISGNGRGDNTLSGWFNVLEIGYDDTGNLSTFAVDFKQFDEDSTTVGLYGSLRFNSSIPINPIPEPSTVTLMFLGLAGIIAAMRKGRATKNFLTETHRM